MHLVPTLPRTLYLVTLLFTVTETDAEKKNRALSFSSNSDPCHHTVHANSLIQTSKFKIESHIKWNFSQWTLMYSIYSSQWEHMLFLMAALPSVEISPLMSAQAVFF